MEQVDYSLLWSLQGGGHSKCGTEFLLIEFGVLKLRHIIMKKKIIFHYHILTLNENETVKKIYLKQKESNTKGDWYRTLQDDYDFIEEQNNDEEILKISKEDYKKKNKDWTFSILKLFKKKRIQVKKKLDQLVYKKLEIQPYLNSKLFGKKESSWWAYWDQISHCKKNNLKKNILNCSLGCNSVETQNHIF